MRAPSLPPPQSGPELTKPKPKKKKTKRKRRKFYRKSYAPFLSALEQMAEGATEGAPVLRLKGRPVDVRVSTNQKESFSPGLFTH